MLTSWHERRARLRSTSCSAASGMTISHGNRPPVAQHALLGQCPQRQRRVCELMCRCRSLLLLARPCCFCCRCCCRSTGVFDKPLSPADELDALFARVEAAEGRRAARELRRRERRRKRNRSNTGAEPRSPGLPAAATASPMSEWPGLSPLQLPASPITPGPGSAEVSRRRCARAPPRRARLVDRLGQ